MGGARRASAAPGASWMRAGHTASGGGRGDGAAAATVTRGAGGGTSWRRGVVACRGEGASRRDLAVMAAVVESAATAAHTAMPLLVAKERTAAGEKLVAVSAFTTG